jgi:uncharacterized protein YjdB
VALFSGFTGSQKPEQWLCLAGLGGSKLPSFAGAGKGTINPLFTNDISQNFTFNGSSSDLGTHGTLKSLKDQYGAYGKAGDDLINNKYAPMISGNTTFKKTTSKGTWARIRYEGNWTDVKYTYFVDAYQEDSSNYPASDAWVDGRYINANEVWEKGAKFSDHPTSNIVLNNYTYTDINSKKHTGSIKFEYDSETKQWNAKWYYVQDAWYEDSTKLPAEFILTKKQVDAMKLDKNTDTIPSSGLIYDGSVYPGTSFSTVYATGISMKKDLNLVVNETGSVEATVLPSNASEKAIIYSSSDDKVASVNRQNGKVSANGNGTAVITATTEDGNYSSNCAVHVRTVTTEIELNKPYLRLYKNNTEQLKETIAPVTSSDKSVTWSSSDSSVVSVDSKGNVYAVKEGTAVITVKTNDSGLTAKCEVRVVEPVTGITLDKSSIKVLENYSNIKLTATIQPSNAYDKSITWSSSNTKVATVSNSGFVHGVSKGIAVITAYTVNKKYKAECTVHVVSGDPYTVDSIEPEGNPTYNNFYTGEIINTDSITGIEKLCDGLSLKQNCLGGSSYSMVLNVMIQNYGQIEFTLKKDDKSIPKNITLDAGNYSLYADYLGMSTKIRDFTVTKKELSSYSVNADDTALIYQTGDQLKWEQLLSTDITNSNSILTRISSNVVYNNNSKASLTLNELSKIYGYTFKTVITPRNGTNGFVASGVAAKGIYQCVITKDGVANDPNAVTVNICVADKFPDVSSNEWYYSYVSRISTAGIITGYDNGNFGTTDTLTRGQFATILYRMAGKPAISGTAKDFSDTDSSAFYNDAVKWASSSNVKVITGYDNGTFGPNDTVTREQMATMMFRYAKWSKVDTSKTANINKFPDGGSVSTFANDGMSWALGEGLITGDQGNINPQGNAQRCVSATIMYRYLKNIKNEII